MRGGQAVVVGGSIAGVLAGAALARYFDSVVVLERDELPDGPAARKGTPQGQQIHALLPLGDEMIEGLFPGVRAECLEAGCGEYSNVADLAILTGLGWYPRLALEGTNVLAYRRPLLEWLLRRRLLALDNVEIKRAVATGFAVEAERMVGVRVKDGDPIAADLVVEAAGRGTKAPKWLAALGFELPREEEVRVHMGYATQYVEVPPKLLEAGVKGIAAMPRPGHLVGGVLSPSDNGTHALAAVGMLKNYPPSDQDGFFEFLERAPTPLLGEIARRCHPVSDVHTYHQPGNLRRRWEELRNLPRRFVVVGDAVASFNPVYGQGITMAALGASLLDQALAAPGASLESAPGAFQESLREGLDAAFGVSARSDALFEGAELINFSTPDVEETRYLRRVEEAAHYDLDIRATLFEANFRLRPELLADAQTKARVEAWEPPGSPVSVDLRSYPRTVHRATAQPQPT